VVALTDTVMTTNGFVTEPVAWHSVSFPRPARDRSPERPEPAERPEPGERSSRPSRAFGASGAAGDGAGSAAAVRRTTPCAFPRGFGVAGGSAFFAFAWPGAWLCPGASAFAFGSFAFSGFPANAEPGAGTMSTTARAAHANLFIASPLPQVSRSHQSDGSEAARRPSG
jgi:hypothetical protein